MVVATIPRFFHLITWRCCREGCPRKYKICFLGIHNWLSRFLSISIIFYLCQFPNWQNPKARCTGQIEHGEGVTCPNTHTLLHQMPDPNPWLLHYFGFKPSPRPVPSHLPTLSWGQCPAVRLADPFASAILATQVSNRKCFLYHNSFKRRDKSKIPRFVLQPIGDHHKRNF